MNIACSKGHPTKIVSQLTVHETTEDVVYQKERIKHFDREGSEFWTEINVPSIIERTREVDVVEYLCETCGEAGSVRRPR